MSKKLLSRTIIYVSPKVNTKEQKINFILNVYISLPGQTIKIVNILRIFEGLFCSWTNVDSFMCACKILKKFAK